MSASPKLIIHDPGPQVLPEFVAGYLAWHGPFDVNDMRECKSNTLDIVQAETMQHHQA